MLIAKPKAARSAGLGLADPGSVGGTVIAAPAHRHARVPTPIRRANDIATASRFGPPMAIWNMPLLLAGSSCDTTGIARGSGRRHLGRAPHSLSMAQASARRD